MHVNITLQITLTEDAAQELWARDDRNIDKDPADAPTGTPLAKWVGSNAKQTLLSTWEYDAGIDAKVKVIATDS